jgi:hypothetical protein
MNTNEPLGSIKGHQLLTSWGTVSISKKTLLHNSGFILLTGTRIKFGLHVVSQDSDIG